MAQVKVQLPSLLVSLLRISRTQRVSANTLDEALSRLCEETPGLAVHLFDESGALREHVLCFINDTNSRDIDPSGVLLRDDDIITILQAVSGG